MPDNLGIEGVPGETDASVAQKIGRGSASAPNRRTNTEQGKIARAPAEVSDQNQLVSVKRRFVVASRRDWLQFERHGFIASFAECFSQASLGILIVIFVLGTYERYRAPRYGGVDFDAELIFGLLPQVSKNSGDE
jgi:hypothetical protein